MTAALLLAAVAAFLAGVLGGSTGFGISVVLVPLLLLAYDPATVVVLNGAISAAIAAAVAGGSWREANRPAALLLESRGLPKEAFRATIALFFLGMDAALLAVLVLWRVATPGHALLALLLVPAAIAGKAVGTALFGKASQRTFRAAALGTVFLVAALGIVTALRALI